ncbi:hypothetical protein OG735_09890 [Streptomyces sp. NBC_01210]|uniref:hypothetical protein n=1 Tax=Streptomyces sp. NBC_01210 TaxID=2903774 RepID=UPI002E12A33C|nr:hypothetical protein OG735_09890 [Streptomyces sp. NBC_01210]
MYHESSWEPLPARSVAELTLRFVLTVIVLPLHWAMLLAGFAFFLAIAFVGDLFALIPGFEKGFEKTIDALGDRLQVWPRWFVSWPELRHEGDTAFYGRRADKEVADWTRKATAPHGKNKPVPPSTCEIPVRKYRAVGAGYVLRTAEAQGWALRHDEYSDLPHEIRLRRVPEPQTTDAGSTAASSGDPGQAPSVTA